MCAARPWSGTGRTRAAEGERGERPSRGSKREGRAEVVTGWRTAQRSEEQAKRPGAGAVAEEEDGSGDGIACARSSAGGEAKARAAATTTTYVVVQSSVEWNRQGRYQCTSIPGGPCEGLCVQRTEKSVCEGGKESVHSRSNWKVPRALAESRDGRESGCSGNEVTVLRGRGAGDGDGGSSVGTRRTTRTGGLPGKLVRGRRRARVIQ